MTARVVVTTRAGGVSAPPYDENNLALHVGDDVTAVGVNRRRLAESLGVARVQFMQQVHGRDVAFVDEASAADDPAADVPAVDALVTSVPGLAVAVLVADCVPIAIMGERAVAVAHAGRRGIRSAVIAATVAAVRTLDLGPLAAHLGPAVCGGCYEVPRDMQDDVCAVVPQARSVTRRGTPALDLVAAARAQLAALGVECGEDPPCTVEDPAFYSHRRDGVTGRLAVVAMLEP